MFLLAVATHKKTDTVAALVRDVLQSVLTGYIPLTNTTFGGPNLLLNNKNVTFTVRDKYVENATTVGVLSQNVFLKNRPQSGSGPPDIVCGLCVSGTK